MKRFDCILGGFFCDTCKQCGAAQACIACLRTYAANENAFSPGSQLCKRCEKGRRLYEHRARYFEVDDEPTIPCGICGRSVNIRMFAGHVAECLLVWTNKGDDAGRVGVV